MLKIEQRLLVLQKRGKIKHAIFYAPVSNRLSMHSVITKFFNLYYLFLHGRKCDVLKGINIHGVLPNTICFSVDHGSVSVLLKDDESV